jgi:hypothetical protein
MVSRTRVFVTYTHDSDHHKDMVLAFAFLLRNHGLDVRLDAWDDYERKDWYEWGQRQIMLADFIIVVASEQYRKVGDGEVGSTQNRGAQAEVAGLREVLQQDRPRWIQRILPVLLPGHGPDEIPLFLQPLTADHYQVDDFTLTGVDSLIRVLTAQPARIAPPIGQVPDLPPEPTPTVRPQQPSQVNSAHGGGVVFAVQDGDLHVPEGFRVCPNRPDPPSWAQVTEPVDVPWLTGKRDAGVLELHLVPVDEVDRLQMRRLEALPGELAALGRKERLFTVAEGLDCRSSTTSAWARTNHDSPVAGIALTRSGSRSAWTRLPSQIGPVPDRHDIVHRIDMLLRVLMGADAPLPRRFAPAVGVRSRKWMSVRVPVDESIPARLVVDDSTEVVEELAARLLAQFRTATL